MRAFFLLTVSAAALSIGAGVASRHRSRKAEAEGRLSPPEPGFEPRAEQITRWGLQYFVVPIWLAAGLADWGFHRASRIEDTAGLKESILHLLMMLETGAPVLAALLLEIDPPILSLMFAAFFLHEATAMWDVSYAVRRRNVSPLEQHAHSFLELTPLLALTLVSLMHWPQLKALAGLRTEAVKPFRLKRKPLSKAYVGGALGAMTLFEALPYAEEAVRDWLAHPRRLTPRARG
jgi:hypothetical protein